jgi:hypothetical protein
VQHALSVAVEKDLRCICRENTTNQAGFDDVTPTVQIRHTNVSLAQHFIQIAPRVLGHRP